MKMTMPTIMERPAQAVSRMRSASGLARGTIMVETLFMILGIFFLVSLAVYMSHVLKTRQKALAQSRYSVFSHSRPGEKWTNWNRNVYYDVQCWSDYDPAANGPIGTGARGTPMPRGQGEELDYLYANAGRNAENAASNGQANDYFRRIWNNLPGRHERFASVSPELTEQRDVYVYTLAKQRPGLELWRDLEASYYMDSASWTHAQEPLWKIAQYGPMRVIMEQVCQNVESLPSEYGLIQYEILHAWFTELQVHSWEYYGRNNESLPKLELP